MFRDNTMHVPRSSLHMQQETWPVPLKHQSQAVLSKRDHTSADLMAADMSVSICLGQGLSCQHGQAAEIITCYMIQDSCFAETSPCRDQDSNSMYLCLVNILSLACMFSHVLHDLCTTTSPHLAISVKRTWVYPCYRVHSSH